jgi:hypothetical protein
VEARQTARRLERKETGMPGIDPNSGPSGSAAAVLFRSLSRLRGRRIAHPHGIGFEAELSVDAPPLEDPAAGVLADRAVQRAVVRFSRALGLPETLPDILGIALRLPDCYGPGVHQDLLTVTSWRAPLARHTLTAAPGGFLGHFFTTLVPYRVVDRLLMVGLEATPRSRSPHRLDRFAARAPGCEFELVTAGLTKGWNRIGALRIGPRIDDAEINDVRFNPWNTAPGVTPVGPLQKARAEAYAGSQKGWGG